MESGFNQYAIHVNSDKSVDRGLWQISNKYQPYSNETAFDPILATQAAYKIYQAWGNFDAWTSNKKLK